jgi:hypothetical protein
MKVKNLQRASDLRVRLAKIDTAISDAERVLNEYTSNSFGDDHSDTSLYQIRIVEHSDASGFNVDLTGAGFGIELLQFTLEQLKKQRKKVLDEIETL